MLLYWLVFFVLHHTRRSIAVWIQLVVLALVFGANAALGEVLERAAFESWYRSAAVMDWVKAGCAAVFAAFLAIYTGVMHGKAGYTREFAPNWREGIPASRLSKDRGAQVAHIVLLSFLLAYTVLAFATTCAYTSPVWEMKPPNNNAVLYTLIGAYIAFNIYLAWYLWYRQDSPRSAKVSVLADVIVFPLWAAVIAALSGGMLAILARDGADLGEFGAFLAFGSAGFTLIIALYEAVYTAFNGEPGKWRRRFATPPPPRGNNDVELEPPASIAKESHESHCRRESEVPTLSYI